MIVADAQARKGIPIYSGFIRYFPDAIVEVAMLSKKGNDQHNPGQQLHWDRSKSGDELDACMRHLLDAGSIEEPEVDEDGVWHLTKTAWRAMAALQKACEARVRRKSQERADARAHLLTELWSEDDRRLEAARTSEAVRRSAAELKKDVYAAEQCGDPDCCCNDDEILVPAPTVKPRTITIVDEAASIPDEVWKSLALPVEVPPQPLSDAEAQKLFDAAFDERKQFLSRSNTNGRS